MQSNALHHLMNQLSIASLAPRYHDHRRNSRTKADPNLCFMTITVHERISLALALISSWGNAVWIRTARKAMGGRATSRRELESVGSIGTTIVKGWEPSEEWGTRKPCQQQWAWPI